jgi:leucine-rich repeat kinase 1/leucine-rich repeat kinase 2
MYATLPYPPFLPTEIIKEVENDGEKLTDLLRNSTEQLEPNCLNRALMAATKNDNHFNIGKLVVKGAKNLDQCLEYALKENKPHARAMLLLIKAAFSGNKSIVQKLFGETVDKPDNAKEFYDTGFQEVQKAVLSGKVSTVVPIEIARRNGHLHVREELLLKTDVNQEDGYVYWHGLRLLQLEIPWLRRINWVKRLRLARNGFKTLPNDMGNYLKQVRKGGEVAWGEGGRRRGVKGVRERGERGKREEEEEQERGVSEEEEGGEGSGGKGHVERGREITEDERGVTRGGGGQEETISLSAWINVTSFVMCMLLPV